MDAQSPVTFLLRGRVGGDWALFAGDPLNYFIECPDGGTQILVHVPREWTELKNRFLNEWFLTFIVRIPQRNALRRIRVRHMTIAAHAVESADVAEDGGAIIRFAGGHVARVPRQSDDANVHKFVEAVREARAEAVAEHKQRRSAMVAWLSGVRRQHDEASTLAKTTVYGAEGVLRLVWAFVARAPYDRARA